MAMGCIEVVEVITAYLEGVMPDADRVRFDAHLDGCEGCRRYLDQMKETIALTRSIPSEVPESVMSRLEQVVAAWQRDRPDTNR